MKKLTVLDELLRRLRKMRAEHEFTNYLLVFADKGVYNIAVYGWIYFF